MEDLRIVFMGTPEFAVATLDSIVQAGYTVVGVITAPDRPAGRGRKLQQSAVKQYALSQGLPVLQPTNLKDPDFLEALAGLKANLQVVVAFRMLPQAIWQMPTYGTFNLHASLLPQYRGAAPINWAIINGETETGVTTFFIDEKIDTGAIIAQDREAITPDDNAGSLHDQLMVRGAQLVLHTLKLIQEGKANPKEQTDMGPLKAAYKIHKETCKINWQADATTIINHIRGLSPYPGAWTQLTNGDSTTILKIYKADFKAGDNDASIGLVSTQKNTIRIAVAGGHIHLHELQVAGKRKMSAAELLNGFHFEDGAQVH